MVGYLCIGMLAAFGLLCGIWVLCGLFLERPRGRIVYLGEDVLLFTQRYLWLRELGLIRCPLAVQEPKQELIPWLDGHGIEIYSPPGAGIGAEEN